MPFYYVLFLAFIPFVKVASDFDAKSGIARMDMTVTLVATPDQGAFRKRIDRMLWRLLNFVSQYKPVITYKVGFGLSLVT